MVWKFRTFDPFTTFSNDGKRFLDRRGGLSNFFNQDNSDDILQLWRLGREAYRALGGIETQADFDAALLEHQNRMKDFAEVLAEDSAHIDFKNEDGISWKPDFSKAPSMEILGVFWQLAEAKDQLFEMLGAHYLFACLEEIDLALMGMALGGDHLHAVINSVTAFGNYQALATGNSDLQKARSELAYIAAMERHAKDPKQTEKLFVLECWKEWRSKPEIYKSKAAFARAMVDKCDHLESTKNIEDWCREWEKTIDL